MPRPTARGWGLLVVAAGAYVAARLLGTWELYLLAIAFAAALLVSWVLVAITARDLSVTRELSPPQPLAGDELLLSFRMRRTSRLPGLQVSLPDAVGELGAGPLRVDFDSLGLRPAGVSTAGPWPVRRGVHRLPPLLAEAEDPLGLVRMARRLAGPEELVVYPRLVQLAACPLVGGEGELVDSSRRGLPVSGSAEFRGIRPYYPGEPLNHVDWKATARTGNLMMREMDDPASGDVTVLLSGAEPEVTGAAPDTSFELAVQAAGSVAAFALRLGRHVTLLRCDRDWRRTRLSPAADDRRRLLESLARVQPHPPLRLGPSLRALLGGGARRARTRLLVLVVLSLDWDLVRALVALRREGLAVAVVLAEGDGVAPASPAAATPDALGLRLSLESSGVPCLALAQGDDLDMAFSLWSARRSRAGAV